MPATANQYYLLLKDTAGNVQAVIADFYSIQYALTLNRPGYLKVSLPKAKYYKLVAEEKRLEIYRSVAGGQAYLEGETAWIIETITATTAENGTQNLEVQAYDLKKLLQRRYVMYSAGSSQSSKTAAADNMAKAIVRENFISPTDTTRTMSNMSCATDSGSAPSISKAFAYRNVLTVIQEIVESSYRAGTYLAFDVVTTGTNSWEFRTYTGQRGTDRRLNGGINPVLLAESLGNLTNVERSDNFSEEANVVYAAGQGEGANRLIQSDSDANSIAKSSYSRKEYFQDARNSDNPTAVLNEARDMLREKRAVRTFSGTLQDTTVTKYGRDYRIGDLLTAQDEKGLIDCLLDAVTVDFSEGRERIGAKLQSIS